MLKQRVITAIVLLLILLPALFYPAAAPFCALALVLVAAGAWEWGRLNGASQTVSYGLAALCLALCGAAWAAGWLTRPLPALWIGVGGFWVLAGAWLLRAGVPRWAGIPQGLRLTVGLLLLCCAWIAVAQARVIGINFLLSSMVLVWVADIFAYFAGKTWGTRFIKRKLAPTVSPGKSWEGVCGGLAGVWLVALAWRWADQHYAVAVPSLYSHLAAPGAWFLLLSSAFMVAMSVLGDLLESLIKRSAGAKDSSGLLPGHGGVLDRLDALLPTLPLSLMFYSLTTL